MNKSTYHPLGNTIRLLVIATLAIALTLGSGKTARAFASPAPVNLGAAASFAILAKTGISNVPTSAITGNLGVSPAAATYITGFPLTADGTNTFSTTPQVTGKIYAANYADPTPANLTTAVLNMQAAYTDAAGRSNPDATELYSGNLSGRTLAPGLYKCNTLRFFNRCLDIPDSRRSYAELRRASFVKRWRTSQQYILAGWRRHGCHDWHDGAR